MRGIVSGWKSDRLAKFNGALVSLIRKITQLPTGALIKTVIALNITDSADFAVMPPLVYNPNNFNYHQ